MKKHVLERRRLEPLHGGHFALIDENLAMNIENNSTLVDSFVSSDMWWLKLESVHKVQNQLVHKLHDFSSYLEAGARVKSRESDSDCDACYRAREEASPSRRGRRVDKENLKFQFLSTPPFLSSLSSLNEMGVKQRP